MQQIREAASDHRVNVLHDNPGVPVQNENQLDVVFFT